MITMDETMTEHCIVNCCMETNNSDVVGKVQLKVLCVNEKTTACILPKDPTRAL